MVSFFGFNIEVYVKIFLFKNLQKQINYLSLLDITKLTFLFDDKNNKRTHKTLFKSNIFIIKIINEILQKMGFKSLINIYYEFKKEVSLTWL